MKRKYEGGHGSNKKAKVTRRKVRFAARSFRKKKAAATKFVKNVIDSKAMCSEPVGHYTKQYGLELANPSGLVGSDVIYVGGTRSFTNSAPYTVFGCAFLPNNYKKLLDAASVLFNGKTAAVDFENGTNNFATNLLKLDVMYASYKITLTNNTQQVFYVECVEVINRDSTQTNVIDTASAVALSQKWGGNVLTSGIPTIIKANNEYNVPMPLKFGMYEGLEHKYHFKPVWKRKLKPGKIATYIDIMHQQCIDFQKHNAVGSADLASYARGQKQVFFRFRAKAMNSYKNTGGAQGFTTIYSGNANAAYGIAVDVKETYKILQPNSTSEANESDLRVLFVDFARIADELGVLEVLDDSEQYDEVVGPKS